MTHARKTPAKKPSPPTLSRDEEAFVLEWESNGHNGTRAYLAVKPHVKPTSAAVEAWKLLRRPNIQKWIADARVERFARLEMKADEALARISEHARADLGDAYGDDGKLLPLTAWPEGLRRAVKSIKPGPYGDAVILYDGLRAAELMAQAGGKLKAGSLTISFDHAAYLAARPPGDEEEN